jgi:flagellar hook protein FlgE
MSASSSRDLRAVIEDILEHDFVSASDTVPASELSISGNGFFIVRDAGTNEHYATQCGHFRLDAEGHLVTESGAHVQGRVDGSFSKVGDLRISGAEASTSSCSSMLCYSIDSWGKIMVYLADGTSYLRGQVMLQNFRDPEALVHKGDGLYSNLSAAGPLPGLAAPRTNGLGAIRSCLPQIYRGEPTCWTN